MKKYGLLLLIAMLAASGCGRMPDIESFTDEGVSRELAMFRKKHYENVRYTLHFDLPEQKEQPVTALAIISVDLRGRVPIILDFTGSADDIRSVMVSGTECDYTLQDQHIVISANHVKRGNNVVMVDFTASDQSLNRRDEFMYTLLVPDRARTLFPCFDQPDLKANFELSLEVPEHWTAVGNGSPADEQPAAMARKKLIFRPTEPISTYLFSFVAGKFEKVTEVRGERSISLYHRETDPERTAQCGEILDEVFQAIDWMEEYTDIPYPFEKYDLVILPGFQYGGMEHMGATLYNDRRMFLDRHATTADSLSRSSLIAHETAHMWFGDYVTMEWFNDVWNKEVFANWFAARMVEPRFPAVNHRLNFVASYFPPAYAEDRTGGAMSIQQPLANLSDAGLIYSNIVYNKSPIVMEMLVRKIGEEAFRDAIREYLKKYAYGNADWDKLVVILGRNSKEDLQAWSDTWVKEKGMPAVSFAVEGNQIRIRQTDPWGRGLVWPQTLQFATINQNGVFSYNTVTVSEEETVLELFESGKCYILPNSDGRAYGYFRTDDASASWLLENWGRLDDDVMRFAMLQNLYEGVMNLDVDPVSFVNMVMAFLLDEPNPQIFGQALSCACRCVELFYDDEAETAPMEAFLLDIAKNPPKSEYRTLALRSFTGLASGPTALDAMYRIWNDPRAARDYPVGENDLTQFAYRLALVYPERNILERQLERITNPDRRAEFAFVSQALAPDTTQRREFFEKLLRPESWAVEPWATAALGWLNHPKRYPESLGYIRPALDVLREVQREGDIFFPVNWCAVLFKRHKSPEALETLESFFAENSAYPPLLESKIRLRADHLYIANGRPEDKYQRPQSK